MAFNSYTLGTTPQNKHNFLRWYKVGDPTYVDFPKSNEYIDTCFEEYPVFALTEFYNFSLSFYANLQTLDATADTSNWDLVGINENDDILNTYVGSFSSKDVIVGSSFRFYRTTANPVNNARVTRFAIYNSVSNVLLYRSSRIQVLTASEAVNRYVLVKYRNSRNISNFNYEGLPSFYNQLWLPIEYMKHSKMNELDTYSQGSTGNVVNSAFESKMIWTFRSRRMNADNHEAFLSMLEHDEIYFNGRRFIYYPATPYSDNLQDNISIQSGVFQMAEYNFNIANKDNI